MSLNLEYLRIFYTIAKHKNISAAAEELHTTQPSVSRELQRLENELGFRLFFRHSRGVRLTHEGDYLLRQLQPSIETLLKTEADASLRGLGSGVIRLNYNSYSTQSVLSTYLQEFLDNYPGFALDSSIAKRSLICNLLDYGVADISFGQRPATFTVEHRLDDAPISPWQPETLEGYSLGFFEDELLVGPPLAHLAGKTLRLKDLATYPLMFQRKHDRASQNEYLTRIEQEANVQSQNFCTEDTTTLLYLIQHEPYIAVLSSLAKPQYEKFPQLVPLQIDEPLPKFEYLLHYSRQSPPCLAASVLINYLRNSTHFDFKSLERDHVPQITDTNTDLHL